MGRQTSIQLAYTACTCTTIDLHTSLSALTQDGESIMSGIAVNQRDRASVRTVYRCGRCIGQDGVSAYKPLLPPAKAGGYPASETIDLSYECPMRIASTLDCQKWAGQRQEWPTGAKKVRPSSFSRLCYNAILL